ncbi:hypothetical protein C900_01321 [Fulvivirga imtechensis AK7]|uniref:Uncharacterized protein n=1 Tax=Fulvivirga imtechensis AK7 TaxID=1237149 RepID=L8JWG5_9BACT|nr:hypothetical protein C900_01321 [Fulvivirga imtechensis AK7]
MNDWLHSFAYRIDFSWWFLGAAVLLLTVMALGAISYQLLRTSRINPAVVLKEE